LLARHDAVRFEDARERANDVLAESLSAFDPKQSQVAR
jgi:hypothetical protein